MLILFTPGVPREACFEALVEHGRSMTPEERTELQLRHDQYKP